MTRKTDNKQKYAFLDRDGTLIYEPQDTYQIDSLAKLKILEGVNKGLNRLSALGYKLVLISNQDGLGTSAFPMLEFVGPQEAMLKIFTEWGVVFEAILICPHYETENCFCRKPKTGLVEEFLSNKRLDKKSSFVCGDRASDRYLAKNLGLKFVSMTTNGNFLDAISCFEPINK